MNYFYFIAALIILIILAMILVKKVIVFEYQRALLFNNGICKKIFQAGKHYYFCSGSSIKIIDLRAVNVTLPGQELLTLDNISIKITISAAYKVSDPLLAINSCINYQESLYLILQLTIRDIISSLTIDEVLSKREEINLQLLEKSKEKIEKLGIELQIASIRDIMLSGELKNIFAQVTKAKMEGLASLEKARAESAALRNLANAARDLENNPALYQLRMMQIFEKGTGNSMVIIPSDGFNSRILSKEK